jgi:hypothetical protein
MHPQVVDKQLPDIVDNCEYTELLIVDSSHMSFSSVGVGLEANSPTM